MATGTDRGCPKCGSERVHRSKARSPLERFRKRWSRKRVHRCHDCEWRGWRIETHVEQRQELEVALPPPDFDKIDAAVPLRRGATGGARRERS